MSYNSKGLFRQLNLLVGLLLLAFVLVSCDLHNGFALSRTPRQPWIQVKNLGKVIHITLSVPVIWEPGDDALGLLNHLARNVKLSMDGIPIPREEILYVKQYRAPIKVYDDENNVIGSHYGDDHIYYFSDLQAGLHVGQVEVTSTSGKHYSFMWLFVVPPSR